MSAHLDLTGQADVYSQTPQIATDEAATPGTTHSIHLSVEYSPLALTRVFGLIGTVSMVPVLSRTRSRDDEVIDILLEFSEADPRKLDLLCRKLGQLLETINLQVFADQ